LELQRWREAGGERNRYDKKWETVGVISPFLACGLEVRAGGEGVAGFLPEVLTNARAKAEGVAMDKVDKVSYFGYNEGRTGEKPLLPQEVQQAIAQVLRTGETARIWRDNKGRYHVHAEKVKKVLGP
jgi:hypothetical protein